MGLLDRLLGRLTPETLAQELIGLLRASGENRPMQYVPRENKIVIGTSKDSSVIGIGNLYAEYCAAPRAYRADVLLRFARAQIQGGKKLPPFDEIKGMILPRIRERSYYESIKLKIGMNFPHQIIADDFAVGLAIDLPDAIRESDESQLKDWNLSLDDALALARKNLWERSNEDFRQIQPGVYASPWKDNHDCSRVYLHDLIWQLKVKGAHVAMIPNRDTLLVTGADDEAGLSKIAQMTEDAMDQPRFMSAFALKLNDRKWEPFQPPADHPSHDAFAMLAIKTRILEYENQGAALKEKFKKEGNDIFVSKYSGLARKDGTVYSMSVWTKGVTAVLPKTDWIYFYDPDLGREQSEVADASWERVMSVAGNLMKPLGLYPERFKISEFPSPTQIQQLGKNSEPKY